MMFKGSENVGMGELDFLIYTNGGNSNGTTNTDRTSYYEVLPKNQVDLGLYLEADRMRGLVITPENLENQRQAVKEERRLNGDNVAYGNTSEKLEELVYDNFAYHPSVIGSMEDLDAASVDDVKQFFKTYYAPNNAVLALVGDLDTKDTLAKVKKYFGNIPRQTPPVPADLTEPAKNEERHGERRGTLDDPLARLTRIDIAYRIPPSSSPDARALAAAAQILGGGGGFGGGGGGGGGGNNSRLYLKLVQEKELVTNVSCNTDRRVGPGTFHISATLRPGKTPEEVEGLIGVWALAEFNPGTWCAGAPPAELPFMLSFGPGTYVFTLETRTVSGVVLHDSYPYADLVVTPLVSLDLDLAHVRGVAFDARQRMWIWDGNFLHPMKFVYDGYIFDPTSRSLYLTRSYDEVTVQ